MSNSRIRQFDALPGRDLISRWVLTGKLVLKTATHFAGQADSALDMPILRCAKTNKPLLLGTTLGGALRAYGMDRLAGYAGQQKTLIATIGDAEYAINELFGGGRGKDESQSLLIVFDSLGILPFAGCGTEIRDGVMIAMETGTAAPHKKYDWEVLPPETTFDIRIDLLVPKNPAETAPKNANEEQLIKLLCLCLDGLAPGEIKLGARRSRGLGEISCINWQAQRFDLASAEGWLKWIGQDHSLYSPGNGEIRAISAVNQEWPTITNSECEFADLRQRAILEVEAEVLGELLIRSPATTADAPDVAHLTSGGKPIITGTSLAGVIRAHALRVARLVRQQQGDGDLWVNQLMGPRLENDCDPDFKSRGSRLRIAERTIDGGTSKRLVRIAIDRFTQEAVTHALFDEQPQLGGSVNLLLEIRNPEEGELGLLLLVLKDLLTARLPLGGTSSVGRGNLMGKSLTLTGNDFEKPINIKFDYHQIRQGIVPSDENGKLNELVSAFVQAKTRIDNTPKDRGTSS